MKKILIYGDSNTWGDNLITKKRLADEYLWANKLNNLLGSDYKVLQEGLPGRQAGNKDEIEPYKNGKDSFEAIFKSNAPIDTLIIALGTNDLNKKFLNSAQDIINNLLWYEDKVKEIYEYLPDKYFNNKFPNIYYLLPVNFNVERSFPQESEDKRQELITYFKNNKSNQSIIVDNVTLVDGLHMDIEGHDKVSKIVYEFIKKNS